MNESPTRSAENVRAITTVLRTVVRAFRAGQTYLSNSPMLPKAIDDAREALRGLWASEASLPLTITEKALFVGAHEVYREQANSSTALPWLLYRDGLRELELLPGVEVAEFDRLLGILHVSRVATSEDDDLVTLLWVADFAHVRFQHVEWTGGLPDGTFADRDFFESSDHEVDPRPPMSHMLEATAPGEGPPPAIRLFDDDESALMAFDASEARDLQAAIRSEYTTDQLPAVIDSLFDILVTQEDTAVRDEVCDILERLVADALTREDYTTVARILRGARGAEHAAPGLHEESRRALRALASQAHTPPVIERLLHTLERGAGGLGEEALHDLLDGLGSDACAVLCAWYGRVPAGTARKVIEQVAGTLFTARPTLLRRILDEAPDAVLVGALQFARVVPNPGLVEPLAKRFLVGREETSGLAALALAAIATPGAMEVLVGAIAHPAREVRLSVYRAIASTRYRGAFAVLRRELEARAIRQADLTEKRAFVEACVAAGGDEATPMLDALLNGKSLLRHREPADVRACAAYGLGLIGTASALASLQRAAASTDPIVKRAISQAMRGEA